MDSQSQYRYVADFATPMIRGIAVKRVSRWLTNNEKNLLVRDFLYSLLRVQFR